MYLQQHQQQAISSGVSLSIDIEASGNTTGQDWHLATVRGHVVSYSEFGDPAGFPLLYCHQFGGSRLEARALHETARRRGFRIVAADRPGLGHSEPVGRPMPPGGDLAALARILGLRSYGLLAWGGGAGYALELAQHDPESARFCLLLSCPHLQLAGAFESRGSGRVRTSWLKSALEFGLQWHCRLAGQWGGTEKKVLSLERVASPVDRRLLQRPAVRRWLCTALEEAARQGSCGPARDVAGSLRGCRFEPENIHVPVEFWYGASDRLVNACGGRSLAMHLPDARVRRLGGAGHFFFLRHQDIVFDRLAALAGSNAPLRRRSLTRTEGCHSKQRALVA